uniref:Uncharacterized protein n=1 Tax=candidate division CPR3 bacterium TaxID=2268181 RepID=A0A7C4R2G2_UNCC3
MMDLLDKVCGFSYYLYHFNIVFLPIFTIILWINFGKFEKEAKPVNPKYKEGYLLLIKEQERTLKIYTIVCIIVSILAIVFLIFKNVTIMYIFVFIFVFLYFNAFPLIGGFVNDFLLLFTLFFALILVLSPPCVFGIRNKSYAINFSGQITPQHLSYRLNKVVKLKKELEKHKRETTALIRDFSKELDSHKKVILYICKKSVDCSQGLEVASKNKEINSRLAIIQKESFYLSKLEERKEVLSNSCKELEFLIWSINADKKMLEANEAFKNKDLIVEVDRVIKENETYLKESRDNILKEGAQDAETVWKDITSDLKNRGEDD